MRSEVRGGAISPRALIFIVAYFRGDSRFGEESEEGGEGLTENTVELKIVSPVTGVAIVCGAKEFESCCPVFCGWENEASVRNLVGEQLGG